jgi:hypothetical protein
LTIVSSVQQLEHEELAAGGLSEIDDVHDVAVAQEHRHVSLGDQHVAKLRVGRKRRLDALEHHELAETPRALHLRQVDLSRTAVGDPPEDRVSA